MVFFFKVIFKMVFGILFIKFDFRIGGRKKGEDKRICFLVELVFDRIVLLEVFKIF